MTTLFVYEHLTSLGADRDAIVRPAPSLLAEGRAMLDAIVHDLQRIEGVEVLSMAEPDAPEVFRSYVSRSDYSTIIAPEFDGILESRCRWVLEAGGQLLGPSLEAIRLASDKLALFQHLKEHRIATPETWRPGSCPNLYPQVWKPRDGAGSQATFLVEDERGRDDVARRLEAEQRTDMIVQPYVAGTPASVAFLTGPGGHWALQPAYQWIAEDGRFGYLGGACPIEASLVERAIRIAGGALATIAGLKGYVGVDVVLGRDESEDQVIEINPRLTTSYVGLREIADFNIAEAMLRIAEGKQIPPMRWNDRGVAFDPDGKVRLE